MADNKQYKDATFRHLFNTKKNILELYKAVSGDCSLSEEDIELVTLDYAFDNGRRNDLAFISGNRLIVLCEHQSTINKNMALRFFLYYASYLDKSFSGEKLYRQGRIILPEPRFYVFYAGRDKMPEQWEDHLKYSFENQSGGAWVDLKVEWYNINKSAEGKILSRSQLLKGFSILLAKVEKYRAMGMSLKQAVVKAVDECLKEGILVEFLSENYEEVKTMFCTEFNMEEALRVRGEESLEEGIGIGEAKGLEKGIGIGEAIGEKKGVAKGRIEAIITSVKKIMQKLNLGAYGAMDFLDVSAADRPAVLAALS